MARQSHTAVVAPGTRSTTGAALTQTAADTSNNEQTTLTGREMLLAFNSGGSAYTVTVTSVADGQGRTKDISADSLAAGATRIYGPFDTEGWLQSDGKLYFQASNAAVKFSVIRLP